MGRGELPQLLAEDVYRDALHGREDVDLGGVAPEDGPGSEAREVRVCHQGAEQLGDLRSSGRGMRAAGAETLGMLGQAGGEDSGHLSTVARVQPL